MTEYTEKFTVLAFPLSENDLFESINYLIEKTNNQEKEIELLKKRVLSMEVANDVNGPPVGLTKLSLLWIKHMPPSDKLPPE